MSSDDFIKIVPELKAYHTLVDWMAPFADILCETADPQLLESQEEFNPAVQQKILANETHFNAKEVAILQDAFNNYRASGGGDAVDVDALTSDFPLEMSEDRFCRVFTSFGSRANGSDIDVFSFVSALSVACRGSTKEKAEFAFKLFASVEDGSYMTREDIYGMLRLDITQNPDLESQITALIEKKHPTLNATKSSSSSSLIESMGPRTPSVSGSELGIFVDGIMKGFGKRRNVWDASSSSAQTEALTLTLEEFTAWAIKQKYEMATLRIMREVAFIDLGLVPATKEEELLIATGCYTPYDPTTLVEDDRWYLLERKWYIHWCRYIKIHVKESLQLSPPVTNPTTAATSTPSTSKVQVNGGSTSNKDNYMKNLKGEIIRPKCINNYPLLTSDRRDRILKTSDDIKLGRHYVIICEQLWMALKLWYGGGPEIQRQVVVASDGEPILDIWESETKKKLSKKKSKGKENDTDVEVDEDDDDMEDDASSAPSEEETRQKQELSLPRRMRSGGSVGLANLGNTCYMNSALQCLTNTKLLAEYFLSGMYLEDINRTSTLGLQGKLAEVYGKLAEDMWCVKQKSISPRNFKKSIGRFNEVFRGNDQQDAQELLAFLLSGLSEDLNRIQDKPYIEQPDSDGRAVEEAVAGSDTDKQHDIPGEGEPEEDTPANALLQLKLQPCAIAQRAAAAQAAAVRNRVRRGYTNSNLDQSRCLETKYNLYGVVNHQGALGGGHYTAYAKNFVDDQWYYYDDERVRVVEEQQVVSPSAYLLFYIRSDMEGVLVKDLFPKNMKPGKITDEDIERFVEEGDERRCSVIQGQTSEQTNKEAPNIIESFASRRLARENLPPQVAQCVARELRKLVVQPLDGIRYLPQDEEQLSEIHAEIRGPEDTPYEGGYFTVKLTLTEGFPEQPPRGVFLTKIFHPNVSQPAGDICVNTLKKDWKPTLGLAHVLQVVRCLLIVPFPESSLNDEAGKLFLDSYDEYARRAKLWTNIHAPKRSAVASEETGETSGEEEKKETQSNDNSDNRHKRRAEVAVSSNGGKDVALSTPMKKKKVGIDAEALKKKKANKKKGIKRL
ncbi:Ubiquitin-specific protease [Phytophthora palmivora]|uniref:Ubiquitin-specific protease n=2 Tax=Phytophthora palmivora TaxID=4796 RepID=A0A2P4XWB6_9STRA|nr:Ubiquitin-specific protease [Phytophthora palmivora]